MAVGWGGFLGYRLWLENRQLRLDGDALQNKLATAESSNTEYMAETTRLRLENDRLLAESFHEREAKEALARQLVAMAAEGDRIRAELRRQSTERENAEKALRAELEKTQTRVKTAERRVKTVEQERDTVRQALQAEERESGVSSLKELVELTDKAPRKQAE